MSDVQIAKLMETKRGRRVFYAWLFLAALYEYKWRILLTLALMAGLGVFLYLCEYYWNTPHS